MSSAVSAATRKLAASLPRSTAATCPKWRITTWPYLRAFEREALKSGHAVHSLHEPCPRTTADIPDGRVLDRRPEDVRDRADNSASPRDLCEG